jgi:Uma2 family endonuclease
MAVELVPARLDTATYERIVASGALDDRRVELLDGVIVEMSPNHPPHATAVMRLSWLLSRARSTWMRVQLPLAAADGWMPEPDLALIPEDTRTRDGHPTTALLVCEVAVSSQKIDRGVKADVYAAAGVPVYWLLDVPAGRLEVFEEPSPDGYRMVRLLRGSDVVPAPAEGVPTVSVDWLLADGAPGA